MPHNKQVFGHFFSFVLAFLRSKPGLFFASKNAKSFIFNKSFGLFPRFSIFFLISTYFPCPRAGFQAASRAD